jgi:uncharacterized delta-60 repeat protein
MCDDQAGSRDFSLDPRPFASAALGKAEAIILQPDGRIVVGAAYVAVAGGVLRLHSDGTIDDSFFAQIPNAPVAAIALQPDGKVLVGRWEFLDGPVVLGYLDRLLSNGALDSEFAATTEVAPIASAWRTILVQPDRKLIVGSRWVYGGSGYPSHLRRYNVDGAWDTNFVCDLDKGLQGAALQPDGRIVIGGSFSQVNGTNRNGVARLNSDGSPDLSFDPGFGATGGVDVVRAVSLQSDGKVVVGGDFTSFAGVSRNGIARLNSDGSLDTLFDPGLGTDGLGVFAMVLQPDGKVIVGGQFTNVAGVRRSGIARLNRDGSLDSEFDGGPAEYDVRALALQPDGRIVIGDRQLGIIRLNGDAPPRLLSIQKQSHGGSVLSLKTRPERSYALQASTNLHDWVALGTNSALGCTLEFTDTDAASFSRRYYRALQLPP